MNAPVVNALVTNAPVTLGPSARPRRALPRRWVAVLAVTGAIDAFSSSLSDGTEAILAISAILASIVLSIWAEERLYVRWSSRRPLFHFAASLTLIPCGLLVGILATVVMAEVFSAKTVSAGTFVGGLWFSTAAIGTTMVLAIDSFGRTLVSSFATRLRLAVLGIVAAWALITGVIAIVVPRAVQHAFTESPSNIQISLGPGAMNGLEFREFLEQRAEVPEWIRGIGAADLVGLILLVALMVLLVPAVLSAASKLADLAMERIHPLDLAMGRVGAGDLAVRVEEGGNVELRRLATQFNRMVDSLELARRMEQAFGAYVSRPVLERIRARHGALELPTLQREATVFFADIRGFTQLSEELPPQQTLDLLRSYYADVLEVISAAEGYVDKFIGDAIYVVFNGPIDQPDHVARATRCAIAVLERIALRNADPALPAIERLEVGIGVATGQVIAGNLGTLHSTQFSVIGDTVNLAARLSSRAPAGEIWISRATEAQLPPETPRTRLEAIRVKGRAQPVAPYRLSTNGV